MASARPARKNLRFITVELAIFALVSSLFVLKIVNYTNPEALRLSTISREVSVAFDNAVSAIGNIPLFNSCTAGLKMDDISGGYVCAQPSATGQDAKIYQTYPLVGRGRESIYPSTDEGSIAAANDLLNNVYDVPRFHAVKLPSTPTWSENPFSTIYWRFEFYSLRPELNLLYAYRTTGNVVYAKKLIRLDSSFIAAEPRSPWAWSDPHAVAFRAMTLIDTWWKLRQEHQLTEQASTAILGELEKTGAFLADPNDYQNAENHGTNEAAALYNIGSAFPTLPHAHQWLLLAKQRIEWQLNSNIDADGQLIENSPYYDFYTLEKYWEIYQYMTAQGLSMPRGFESRLKSMLTFASYILQPDSQVPLLGASLEETIHDHGVYSSMAATDPSLLYVLTHGVEGVAPPADSKFFPDSALTVMRSGWQPGAAFQESTYLTYNIGRYRTAHSSLDALGITVYGDGGDLLPDPGLYTYAPGPYHNYFHGTISHNTVVVDGKSQTQGNGIPTKLVSKDGITYQSAESSLYRGVQHRRLVMLLGTDHVLVVDQLHSTSVHTYQQMFHLFPSATLRKSGLTVSGVGGKPGREITIQQLQPQGITESDVIGRTGQNPAGLCSAQYGKLRDCYQINYQTRGRNATYVTLLTIGRPSQVGFRLASSDGGAKLKVVLGGRHLTVSLGHSPTVAPKSWASDATPPPVKAAPVPGGSNGKNWSVVGAGTLGVHSSEKGISGPVSSLTAIGNSPGTMVNDAIRINFNQHNVRLPLKVTGLGCVSQLRLSLSNNDWSKSVSTDLLDNYTQDQAGQWSDTFIGPGGKSGSEGGWTEASSGFNWSAVDGMEIRLEACSGERPVPTVSIGRMQFLPVQKQGKIVFIFDDGYQSILPGAAYMHHYGMPGDVAVIGKYVDYPTQDYLNLFQLQALQNAWGWDMVNHTQEHVDAVQEYYHGNDLTGYANDILQQATWLEANHLNSAPNWIVYPHGATNSVLQAVVARYYMFGRGITDDPDAYPFGNREDVSNLEIQYPGDGEGGVIGYTPPREILSAVRSAEKYHTTLLLTFHRIHSQPSDLPGYPLSLFKRVVNGVHKSGVRVMTLSELDRSNGVPVNNVIHSSAGVRSQIVVRIS